MGILGRVWYEGAQRYVAAILYRVSNGSNDEIWLKDGDADPVLIASYPELVSLSGFSASINVPVFGSDLDSIGYFIAVSEAFQVLTDSQNSTGAFISATTTTNGIPGSNSTLIRGTTADPSGATLISVVGNGILLGGGSRTVSLSSFDGSSGNNHLISLSGNNPASGAPNATTTTTLTQMSNFVNARVQKRAEGTFVYIKNQAYHSVSTEPPNSSLGRDAFNKFDYWDGALNSASNPSAPTTNPADITSNLSFYKGIFAVTSANPLLSGREIFRNDNLTDSAVYRMLTNIDALNNGGADVPITVRTITGSGFTDAPGQVRGLSATARNIMAVALLPA